ncbi:tubby C-terminal-like domain-containing protein [Xylogone sp. PMI_703]|nr:tubby C-terminal-like domain-containing protein [Xylogone sp. PMI_703]
MALAPLAHPIGLTTNFIRPNQPTTLIMRQKIFSLAADNGFNVEDENGTALINVHSKVFTIHNRKYIDDMQGNHLLEIAESVIKIVPKFHFTRPGDGQEVMTVKSHFTLLKTKMDVTFTNAFDGAEIALTAHANWTSWEGEIKLGDQVIAIISRRLLNGREVLGDRTYALTVAPNVDPVMAAGIAICMDAKEHQGEE